MTVLTGNISMGFHGIPGYSPTLTQGMQERVSNVLCSVHWQRVCLDSEYLGTYLSNWKSWFKQAVTQWLDLSWLRAAVPIIPPPH